MAKTSTRPRTGQKRKANQPVKIDRLPAYVHDAILMLRNSAGKTWQEIETLSSEPYGDGKLGFIDWEALPLDVLELFPAMRLPHSNLHRWYDLRVAQVVQQVKQQSDAAQKIGKLFADAVLDGANESVMNAAREQIMALIANGTTAADSLKIATALTNLAAIQQSARANDIKERKVTVEERRIKQLEKNAELQRKRLERELEVTEKKVTNGGVITKEALNRLRERAFGLPP